MSFLRRFYQDGRLSQHLLWLACSAGVVGLLGSRAVVALSSGVAMLAVLANPRLRYDWRNYLQSGAALRAAALYGLFLFSTFYTQEWAEWRHQLYRLLPWLAVPLAFTVAVPLSGRQRLAVGSLFVLGVAGVGLATVRQYFLDPAAANAAINIGQNMPTATRVFHIDFGLMLGLAFFFGLLLARSQLVPRWLRGALLLAVLAMVLTLHILAYRTGLLVLYSTLLAEALRLVLRKRLLLGLGLLLGLLLTPYVLYHTLTPVRQRLGSSRWDIEQFTQGHDINNYSLSRRLAAWYTAAAVIRQHPLLGVGPADADQAMLAQYERRDFGLLPANRVMVHNQYLEFLLASGVMGLLLWLGLLFAPLVQPKQRRNPYIRHFVVVMAVGSLVDSLLEMQIGYSLFVFGYGFLVVAGERYQYEKELTDSLKAH